MVDGESFIKTAECDEEGTVEVGTRLVERPAPEEMVSIQRPNAVREGASG